MQPIGQVPSNESETNDKSYELLLESIGYLRKTGVRVAAWDLDDFLISTHELFSAQTALYRGRVLKDLGNPFTEEEFETTFEKVNREIHTVVGVNPARWELIIKKLVDSFGLDKDIMMSRLDILMGIYDKCPKLAPGALEFLKAFNEAGFRQVIVTHGDQDWSELKLRESGVDDLVDAVEIVPAYVLHKNPFYWAKALLSYEINVRNPEIECIAGGDNSISDIEAARQLGVQHLIWKTPSWGHFYDGNEPANVIKIDELTEAGPALGRYLELNAN